MKLSIAIPCYESRGMGIQLLMHQFKIFKNQTFKDFEVVLSDHSINSDIEKLCLKNPFSLNLVYNRNPNNRGNSSANTNNAIRKCSGDIIKILFQDDFLYSNEALDQTIKAFDDNTEWLVSACEHTNDGGKTFNRPFYPKYNDNIHLGDNTISSPSVLSIKNTTQKLYFDESLIWLMDVEYYKRCHKIFGEPTILNSITVVNRIWGSQLTNSITEEVKNKEVAYTRKLYNND